MWGLLLLFFAAVYFAVVGTLLFKVKPIGGKVLVLIAAILIPNADDWYYRNKLANYCKTEAGFKIYQQVSPKDGLVDKATSGAGFLKRIPVSYIEWPEKTGGKTVGYWRADRLPEGVISKPYKISQYTAPYEVTRSEQKVGPFTEVKQQVIERSQGTAIGEFIGVYYYGGWYPGALVGTGGIVAGCGRDGQVLLHRQWAQSVDATKDYDGNVFSYYELINRVFSKE
jgi:hypothetical protein